MLSLTGGLLGLVIGGVLGLTGAGGGIFAVPALVIGLGMDIRAAAPVALLAVGAAAALGALQGLRQGIVRYKAAIMLAVAGTATAPLGMQLAHWLSPRWLNSVFVAIMLVVAYRMFMSSRGERAEDLTDVQVKVCKVSKDTGRFVWNVRTATTLGGIGLVSGLATGMLGVGGGFIIVPALAHFSELRMHSIVATSLMVIALLSVVTVFIAWSHGLLLLTAPTWTFVLAALVGMAAGRVLAERIPSRMLQRVFSITCVFVAVLMLMRNIG